MGVFYDQSEFDKKIDDNIQSNYKQIESASADALKNWEAKDFLGFGEDMGDAVQAALDQCPLSNLSLTQSELADVITGIIYEIAGRCDN